MKSRRKNDSEGPHATLGSNRRSSNLIINGGVYSEPLPNDLIMDILSRLPLKFIGKSCCLSKLWASIIGFPYFTELFLTKSSTPPQLLFACHNEYRKLFFFSTPQPQNPNDNMVVVAKKVNHFPISDCGDIFSPIRGLVCLTEKKGKKRDVLVICNPRTGKSLTLPKLVMGRRIGLKSYFGYDLVEKQYKVLSMTWTYTRDNVISKEHQVLTLGTNKLSWRKVECCITHFPIIGDNGICINGVLYYTASVNLRSDISMIICFDVKSEKFSFVKVMETFTSKGGPCKTIMINYGGKLGSISEMYYPLSNSFELWVLEDAATHRWSKHVYVLPFSWRHVVGMIGTKVIVFSTSQKVRVPFHVWYYNIERKTLAKVEIQGMEAFQGIRVYTYLDHVESLIRL